MIPVPIRHSTQPLKHLTDNLLVNPLQKDSELCLDHLTTSSCKVGLHMTCTFQCVCCQQVPERTFIGDVFNVVGELHLPHPNWGHQLRPWLKVQMQHRLDVDAIEGGIKTVVLDISLRDVDACLESLFSAGCLAPKLDHPTFQPQTCPPS